MTTIPCRSCGDRIGFVETPQGRKIPVNPEMVRGFWVRRPARTTDSRIVLVLENGETRSGYLTSLTVEGAEAVEGYVSHFATCTDPTRWRGQR